MRFMSISSFSISSSKILKHYILDALGLYIICIVPIFLLGRKNSNILFSLVSNIQYLNLQAISIVILKDMFN
jgi:hypothetical protein